MAMSSRPGDWNCRSCHHLNFQRRESCQRCADPRPAPCGGDYGGIRGYTLGGGGGGGAGGFLTGPDVRPGDWYCAVGNCGTHNFASRSTCFNCGAYKDDIPSEFDRRGGGGGSGSGRSAWKSGDWICTRLGCNEHNFANRMDCFGCGAPRDFDIRPSY